jgi:hypothetical protein
LILLSDDSQEKDIEFMQDFGCELLSI